MESAVGMQLQSYLHNENLVSHRQFGFSAGHGTADLLTIISQECTNSLDKGDEVCIVALDIKGAFDKVWHNGLMSKLKSKGVDRKAHAWMT